MGTGVKNSVRAPRSGHRRTLAELQSERWFDVSAMITGLLLRYWVRRYVVLGVKNVPSQGGTFLIANHTTGMDPVFLVYPLRKQRPMGPGKIELFANPVFALLLRKIGIFPIRQGVADASAVRSMVELYRAGWTVVVYPEGGRSRDGQLLPFMPEFARLVIKLRARVVPAGLVGGRDVLPVGAYLPRRNVPVVVSFGAPFELSEYYDRKLTSEETNHASALLEKRVAEQIAIASAAREVRNAPKE